MTSGYVGGAAAQLAVRRVISPSSVARHSTAVSRHDGARCRPRDARGRTVSAMTSAIERLDAEHYVSLTTFRRDGTAVPTPVWLAGDGTALYVWTPTRSGKVKRIRRRPEVTLAACDARGRVRGEAVPAIAEL